MLLTNLTSHHIPETVNGQKKKIKYTTLAQSCM